MSKAYKAFTIRNMCAEPSCTASAPVGMIVIRKGKAKFYCHPCFYTWVAKHEGHNK